MKNLKNLYLFIPLLLLLTSCDTTSIQAEVEQNKEDKYQEYIEAHADGDNNSTNKTANLIEAADDLLKDPTAFAKDYFKRLKAEVIQDSNGNPLEMEYDYNYDGDTINFIAKSTMSSGELQWSAGDSIVVRHLLIDSSEMKDKETGKQQPYAKEAQRYTENILMNAKKIELIFDAGDKLDKYNRKLAYVVVDNKLLGEMLLRQGLAKIRYVEKPNVLFIEPFNTAQKMAQKDKLNIWKSN